MGKKILLADDSITIQKVIELTFSDEDFDVVTVGNGRLALERLAEVRPDIVLCDIIMPEKDGYEVCEQIKSSPSWSHLPVLLLTGAFEPFDQERATRAGYDGSLAKPFEPETLIAKVKELLARAPRSAAVRPAAPEPLAPAAPSFAPPPASVASPAAVVHPDHSGAFIPEEPFPILGSFASDPAAATIPSAPARPPLAEITEEEAAALAPPAFEEPAEDSVSTVMFRASDLPWAATPTAPAPAETPGPLLVPEAGAPAGPAAEPVAESAEELPEEPPVFEAVLEEDLEFAESPYASELEPEPQPIEEAIVEPFADASGVSPAEEDIFAPELTARGPVSGVGEGASGAFAALVSEQLTVPEGTNTNAFAAPVLPRAPLAAAAPTTLPPLSVESAAQQESGQGAIDRDVEEQSLPEGTEAPGAQDALPEPILEESWGAPQEAASEPEALAPIEGELEPEPVFETEPQPVPVAGAPFGEAPAIGGPSVAGEALSSPLEEPTTLREAAPFDEAWPEEPLSVEEPLDELPEPALAPLPPLAIPEPPAPPERPAAASFEPAVLAPPVAATTAPAAPPVPEESFGDVAEALAGAEPAIQPPSSEAAAVAVPVDMVEKIAQRVVAQVSEKAVREIAWEVIPDLAEALIKQEIEKLKAELAKL